MNEITESIRSGGLRINSQGGTSHAFFHVSTNRYLGIPVGSTDKTAQVCRQIAWGLWSKQELRGSLFYAGWEAQSYGINTFRHLEKNKGKPRSSHRRGKNC